MLVLVLVLICLLLSLDSCGSFRQKLTYVQHRILSCRPASVSRSTKEWSYSIEFFVDFHTLFHTPILFSNGMPFFFSWQAVNKTLYLFYLIRTVFRFLILRNALQVSS